MVFPILDWDVFTWFATEFFTAVYIMSKFADKDSNLSMRTSQSICITINPVGWEHLTFTRFGSCHATFFFPSKSSATNNTVSLTSKCQL